MWYVCTSVFFNQISSRLELAFKCRRNRICCCLTILFERHSGSASWSARSVTQREGDSWTVAFLSQGIPSEADLPAREMSHPLPAGNPSTPATERPTAPPAGGSERPSPSFLSRSVALSAALVLVSSSGLSWLSLRLKKATRDCSSLLILGRVGVSLENCFDLRLVNLWFPVPGRKRGPCLRPHRSPLGIPWSSWGTSHSSTRCVRSFSRTRPSCQLCFSSWGGTTPSCFRSVWGRGGPGSRALSVQCVTQQVQTTCLSSEGCRLKSPSRRSDFIVGPLSEAPNQQTVLPRPLNYPWFWRKTSVK